MIKVKAHDFLNLYNLLENSYELQISIRMLVLQKIEIFIFILAQGVSNRIL